LNVIAREVRRQEERGVIEPSNAEWDFFVFLFPKSDGTMRF